MGAWKVGLLYTDFCRVVCFAIRCVAELIGVAGWISACFEAQKGLFCYRHLGVLAGNGWVKGDIEGALSCHGKRCLVSERGAEAGVRRR